MDCIAVTVCPQIGGGGIVYYRAVGGEYQLFVSLDIIIRLDVCAVPYFFFAADTLEQLLYSVPIISILKLVAVSPNVEEIGEISGLFA